jgi:hypothetical protein
LLPFRLGRAVAPALAVLPAALLAALALSVQPVSRVKAQEMERCGPGARVLTGAWTTTETTDGENTSLWRGSLRLVHRRMSDRTGEVAGRWEPPGGAPERTVYGTLVDGVLQAAVGGTEAQPAAAVEAAPARTWVLSISSDGTLLTGYWFEAGRGPGTAPRQGHLVASGEASCLRQDAAAAAEPVPGAAAEPVLCPAWDVTGRWEVAAPSDDAPPWPAWRLRLWQDGEVVLGWYEPGAPPPGMDAATPFAWVVDGTLRGRTLLLQHHLGDSAVIARTLVLGAEGTSLTGAWPLPFGPAEQEVLRGQAQCVG